MHPNAERNRLAADAGRLANWKRWGPYLAERQWGTVREDYSRGRRLLGLLPARPGPQPRLSLGRRRPARHHRPRVPALLCAGALERPRPDPEGAALRPHRPRGQSRRGREGVLLLPRLDADAFLHEGALQVSAGRVPVRAAGRGEPAPRQAASPSSSWPTPASSTRTATSTSSPSTPRPPGRHPDPHHRRQPRAGSGDAAPAADALVPQHLDRGAARTKGAGSSRASQAPGDRRVAGRARHARARFTSASPSRVRTARRPRWLFTENETNTERLFGADTWTPYVKDAFHEYRGPRPHATR